MNALHFGPRRPPSSRILGAFFEPQIAAVTVTDHAPVHVRDNMIERDIILTHQSGCELRGAVDGAAKIVAPVYTFRSRWTTCFPGLRNQHALRFR